MARSAKPLTLPEAQTELEALTARINKLNQRREALIAFVRKETGIFKGSKALRDTLKYALVAYEVLQFEDRLTTRELLSRCIDRDLKLFSLVTEGMLYGALKRRSDVFTAGKQGATDNTAGWTLKKGHKVPTE